MRAVLSLLFVLFALPGAAVAVAADNYKAGVDYIELNPPLPVRVPDGKVEVIEFFNFSCPHCFRLQGHLAKWRAKHLKDDVVFVHQPLVFQRFKGHFARVYYTIEGLKREKDLLPQVYQALHVDGVLLNSRGRFLGWLEEQGVDGDRAEQMYDSFTVKSRTARAGTIALDYDVNSTPQMAVGGKYVLSPRLSRSYDRMLDTLTALIERERKELAQAAQ